MLLEHERYYGMGMGALVTVCSWNTSVIMVWAWMLWLRCCETDSHPTYMTSATTFRLVVFKRS